MWEAMKAECVPEETLDQDGYLYEVKLDGTRCSAIVYPDQTVVLTGRGKLGDKFTERFPEIVRALAACVYSKRGPTIVDGELVCWKEGKPNFNAVAGRAHRQHDIEAAMRKDPANYHIFDCLVFDGKSLVDLPLRKRKEALSTAVKGHGNIEVVPFGYQGRKLYEFVKMVGLEGVVCKTLDGLYLAGKRSKTWGKIKCGYVGNFWAVGVTHGNGKRADMFGSLILVNDAGEYVGKCGGGLTDLALITWQRHVLETEEGPSSPAVPSAVAKKAKKWFATSIPVRVRYMEYTEKGILRMARVVH